MAGIASIYSGYLDLQSTTTTKAQAENVTSRNSNDDKEEKSTNSQNINQSMNNSPGATQFAIGGDVVFQKPEPAKLIIDMPISEPIFNTEKGIWTQTITIRSTRHDTEVKNLEIVAMFSRPYKTGSYKIMTPDRRGQFTRESFGIVGRTNSSQFHMGLVELDGHAWINLSFISSDRPNLITLSVIPSDYPKPQTDINNK